MSVMGELSSTYKSCLKKASFFYKDHLHKGNVPVLAIAGDRDRICPPEAVFGIVCVNTPLSLFKCALISKGFSYCCLWP